MRVQTIRDTLENHQIGLYFVAVAVAAMAGLQVPETARLGPAINPLIALMLFLTFLQVPLPDLGRALLRVRFLAALLCANFAVGPAVVAVLVHLFPLEPLVELGVLLVLLAPCIDYVVTFSQLARVDARLLLAATPVLLLAQMVLLPIYLELFLGTAAGALIPAGPFFEAFLWLIAAPLALSASIQVAAARSPAMERLSDVLIMCQVPTTTLVLFAVVATVMPQLRLAGTAASSALPIYVLFAVLAPLNGWSVARAFRLEPAAAGAVTFSAATRNSLVVLPLAFAVPGAMPVLPTVIVTQTLVELVFELIYMRIVPRLVGSKDTAARSRR